MIASRSLGLSISRVICCVRQRGNWIFLQDGAKPHTATETKACLDEIAPDRIPNHPAKSPDLNCIEDIWSHMDREVRKQRNVPNIESLKRRLKKIWNNIPKRRFELQLIVCRGDWMLVLSCVESALHTDTIPLLSQLNSFGM